MDNKSQSRIRNILLFPRWEWKVINLEKRSLKEVFISYAFPLILAGAISQFIGSFLYVKNELDIDAYKFSLPLIQSAFFIILQVAIVILATIFLYGLAGKFGSNKDFIRSGKLIIYSLTPLYMLYVVANLHASLTWTLIPGLYSVYLLWTGLPVLLNTHALKRPAFVMIMCISILGILFVTSRLLEISTSIIFPGVSE
ncbi:MAG: YIP1 family protein [Lentimicrobium sp.]|nr:YIP1 family protein [Lentimicrobium sp.]